MPKLKHPNGPYWMALEATERRIIQDALTLTDGNLKRAADVLGINRNFLRLRCNQLDVDVNLIRGNGRHHRPPPEPATEISDTWLTKDAL